jgi:hypothetical protein
MLLSKAPDRSGGTLCRPRRRTTQRRTPPPIAAHPRPTTRRPSPPPSPGGRHQRRCRPPPSSGERPRRIPSIVELVDPGAGNGCLCLALALSKAAWDEPGWCLVASLFATNQDHPDSTGVVRWAAVVAGRVVEWPLPSSATRWPLPSAAVRWPLPSSATRWPLPSSAAHQPPPSPGGQPQSKRGADQRAGMAAGDDGERPLPCVGPAACLS